MATVTVRAYETYPTGDYVVSIRDYDFQKGEYLGKPANQYHWMSDIVVGSLTDKQIQWWTSDIVTTSEKNKLRQMLLALRMNVEPGANINLDDCIGKRLIVTVVEKEKEDGSKVSPVVAWKALPEAKSKGTSPTPSAEDPFDKKATSNDNGNAPATERQKALLNALFEEQLYEPDEEEMFLDIRFGGQGARERLTQTQAKKAIEELQNKKTA